MKAILLFGGNSDERFVSGASAQNLSKQFPFDEIWYMHFSGEISQTTVDELSRLERPFENEFKPSQKPFAKNLEEAIPKIGSRAVFMGFHGTQGEDGHIQSLFEKHKIPFTGSGAKSSAICFDKKKAKDAVRGQLQLADELILRASQGSSWDTDLRSFFKKHGAIVVKPIASGSSVGLHIIRNQEQLERALADISKAKKVDSMAEQFIEGRELTVGIVQTKKDLIALPASEVILDQGRSFDYQGKYLGKGTVEVTPAEVTESEMKAAQDLAMKAHQILGCRGYTRTDLILTSKGPYYLETNTLPGMTKASFIPQQLAAAGISVKDFLQEQLELSVGAGK